MRSRITITISQDLLSKVDTAIDGNTIRNRSQAIETLLRQAIEPKIDTAVILAGGPGTKLPAHKGKPAALIPLGNTTLIEHTLAHLKHFGFTTIILTVSAKDTTIKKLLGNGRRFGLNIIYSQESTPVGTGGALKKATHLIPKQPFLLLHADILTNINLDEFTNFFIGQDKLAAVAIKPRPGKLSYGRVYLEGSNIIAFEEPKKETAISLINTGIYLLDHACLNLLPKTKRFRLEDTLIPKLVHDKQLSGYTFQGVWFDVTAPEDYHEAKSHLSEL